MFYAKLEVWPRGDKSKAYHVGEIKAGLVELAGPYGTYEVELGRLDGRGVWRRGRVSGHDRQRRGPYDLLYRILHTLLGRRVPAHVEPEAGVEGITVEQLSGAVDGKVYVVRGTSGAYDYRQEWPVIASLDKESAQAFAVRATMAAHDLGYHADAPDPDRLAGDDLQPHPLDPRCADLVTLDGVRYFVETVELARPLTGEESG